VEVAVVEEGGLGRGCYQRDNYGDVFCHATGVDGDWLRTWAVDHDLWFSPITKRKVTVDQKIKSRHTANAVLKQAGIPKAF